MRPSDKDISGEQMQSIRYLLKVLDKLNHDGRIARDLGFSISYGNFIITFSDMWSA